MPSGVYDRTGIVLRIQPSLLLAILLVSTSIFLLGDQAGETLYLACRSLLRGMEGFSYILVFQISLMVGLGLEQIGKKP